jgi:hypothetical protein
LLTDVVDLFAAGDGGAPVTTVTKGHGRLEQRTIRVSAALVGYRPMPGLAQVAEVRTLVTTMKTGEQREHVRYLFTSLTAAHASPTDLLAMSRGHWQIENTLFHVKDDSFGEDRQVLATCRSGEVLCGLRNAAMTLLRGRCALWTEKEPMTGRSQYLDAHPATVLSCL